MLNVRWMKQLCMVLAIVMVVSLLAACGNGNSANSSKETSAPTSDTPSNKADTAKDEVAAEPNAKSNEEYKGEIVLWSWEPEHPTALKAFHEKYPNIKLKVVNNGAGDILTKLQTTISSGGELPDVIRIERDSKVRIFDMDIFENLEEAPYSADASLLFDFDRETFSKDGHLIAIPDDMSISGLAYIKDLAKEYLGSDNPEELEAMYPDWNSLIEKGKEVVQKSNGEVKLFPGLGDVHTIIRAQRKEPYFDGDKLNISALTETIKSLVAFRDSGTVDKLDQWTPAWNASFGQSKYIFAISPIWMPQYVIGANDKAEGRWGLMVPPAGGYIKGGSSHAIPKGAKNKELAWKWIEFSSLTQEGADSLKADGVFTHFKQAYDNPEFAKWTWPNFGSQDIGEKYFVDIAAVTSDVSENVNDIILGDAMGIVLQTLTKDKSFGVDQALERVKKEIKAKEPKIIIE
ncbi:MAG: extracellular solute-binding protein [Paenibacillaceae bacterium]